MPFYAVAKGRRPGIYNTWDEASAQVMGFAGARHKKFSSVSDAEAFIAANGGGGGGGGASTASPPGKRGREDAGPAAGASAGPMHASTWHAAPTSGRDASGPCLVQQQQQHRAAPTAQPQPHARQPSPVQRFQPPRSHYQPGLQGLAASTNPFQRFSNNVAANSEPSASHAAETALPSAREAKRPRLPAGAAAAAAAAVSDPDPQDPSTLVAFCDGSNVGNGAPGSSAAWACLFPHNPAWDRAEPLAGPLSTNNRAEYTAALAAMQRANEQDPGKSQPLYIFSDSMLLIRSMTEWIGGWQRRGWVKSDGKPVLNQDLLEALLREQGTRRVIWKHVKAHTSGMDWESVWNRRVDEAARQQAEAQKAARR